MFDGCEEYFAFLHVCRTKNCIVHLKNENITINPNETDVARSVSEILYFGMAQYPQMIEQYLRYLINRQDMTWENVKNPNAPTVASTDMARTANGCRDSMNLF